MLSYKQYIRIIHFSCFFLIFPENVQKNDNKYILKKNDIWRCNSVAKSFIFNINQKLQKSDENWWRNKTLKSAHTIKKKWRKTQIKWTRSEQIPASRLIEHCQATLEWTDILWLNTFSSAHYYGGYLKWKKKKILFIFFRYTLPLFKIVFSTR